jgi:hypothetical protein
VPASIDGIVKFPCAPVTALNSTLVASFTTLMSAPGITAPEVSVTTPERDDVAPPPCAKAAGVIKATRATVITVNLSADCFIETLRGLQFKRAVVRGAEVLPRPPEGTLLPGLCVRETIRPDRSGRQPFVTLNSILVRGYQDEPVLVARSEVAPQRITAL